MPGVTIQPERQRKDSPRSSRLGPGDWVEVSVYGVAELATKARLRNDGDWVGRADFCW